VSEYITAHQHSQDVSLQRYSRWFMLKNTGQKTN